MNTNDSLIPTDLPAWVADHLDEILTWGAAPMGRGCFVPGCRRDAHLLGLCKTHHLRAKRAWNPAPSQERYRRQPQPESPSRLATTAATTEENR